MQHTTTFHLDVVDAEKIIFSDKVNYFVVSSTEGELGIYPNHIPILTILKNGVLRLQVPNHSTQLVFAICGGFLEVRDNRATILADTVVRSDELDEQRLIEQKQQALDKLKNDKESSKTQIELEIVLAQLKTFEYIRNRKD
jgi:F-type H+-transporting ATPase subunit epsilon